MMRNDVPKVVCLCGSTRFKADFLDAQKEKTLDGEIVLTVGFYPHVDCDEPIDSLTKSLLDRLHLDKIDLADYIYVINRGGYIGESTAREILHAKNTGKPVEYMFPEHGPYDPGKGGSC